MSALFSGNHKGCPYITDEPSATQFNIIKNSDSLFLSSVFFYNFLSYLFSSSELLTTVIDENHMAIHAHSGFRVMPFTG
jgi:hypothetical protein